MSEPILYINYYECPCGEEWSDEWSCRCNDRCPSCNKEMEPSDSEETDLLIEAEVILGRIREAQDKFTSALEELEQLFGIDLDPSLDYAEQELTQLV